MNLPVKGTVWKHARRTDWNGLPVELTVTSITDGKVYSTTKYRDRIKTPVELFEKLCLEVVFVPEATVPSMGPRLTTAECEALFRRALAAGLAAGESAVPTPIVVTERVNPFDDHSPVVRAYGPYTEGACGFASVVIRPGNSSFARWIKNTHHSNRGYTGGVEFWVEGFGQSYERKRAYAQAFAGVLTAAGVKAHAQSRCD